MLALKRIQLGAKAAGVVGLLFPVLAILAVVILRSTEMIIMLTAIVGTQYLVLYSLGKREKQKARNDKGL